MDALRSILAVRTMQGWISFFSCLHLSNPRISSTRPQTACQTCQPAPSHTSLQGMSADNSGMTGPSERSRILKYMRLAIEQAWKSQEVDEVPVGCVVVHRDPEHGDRILARAFNQTSAMMNSSLHCEMVCIHHILSHTVSRRSSVAGDSGDDASGGGVEIFRDCDLFVTCEPCIMCAYALRQIGIGRVFYGCDNKRFGGSGSLYRLQDRQDSPFPAFPCTGGFLEEECIQLFRDFYDSGNPNAPPHKRARDVVERRMFPSNPLVEMSEQKKPSDSGRMKPEEDEDEQMMVK